MAARYEIRKSETGEFYWTFVAGNGEEIAQSTETYTTKQNASLSIEIIKGSSEATVLDTTDDDIDSDPPSDSFPPETV